MYERLRTMYLDGRLSDAGLDNAVKKRWITTEQAEAIRAEKNPPAASSSSSSTSTATSSDGGLV